MGDHKFNPHAVAKAAGREMVPVMDLGDGVCFARFDIAPLFRPSSDEEGAPMLMVAGLFAIGGKQSPLAINVELRRVLIGEIGAIPVERLKQVLTESPTADTQPVEAPPQ